MAKTITIKRQISPTDVPAADTKSTLHTFDTDGTLLGIKGWIELIPVASTAGTRSVGAAIVIDPEGVSVTGASNSTRTLDGRDSYLTLVQMVTAKHTDMTPRKYVIDIKTKRRCYGDDVLQFAYKASAADEWIAGCSLSFTILEEG